MRQYPFFKLSLGISVFSLSVLVLMPFLMLIIMSLSASSRVIAILSEPNVQFALSLSLTSSLLAALTNTFVGLIIAWVLVRYRFFGQKVLSALIDLPFALPTAVMGIALATLYAPNGLIGAPLAKLGIQVAFTPLGIYLALLVVSLPFMVRALEPALKNLPKNLEEVAMVMGANRVQVFFRVILSTLLPAMLTGFSMMFARAVGEYGSVIFIAGNLPRKSEILPLIIIGKLEQFDIEGASVVALCMLLISLGIMFVLNVIMWRMARRMGAKY